MDQLPTNLVVKAIIVIIFSSALFVCVPATNHSVGGTTGWDLSTNLQNWSSTTTIYTGDNLVFTYGPTHDVLEVNRSAFSMCQTSHPISTHNDGDTVIPLDKPGTRYFICGTSGHCRSGLKLQVIILPLPAEPPEDTDSRPHSPSPPKAQVPHRPSNAKNPKTSPNESEGPTQSSSCKVHNYITSLLFFLHLTMMFCF